MPIVLCDSGPLIALAKLNRLHLLLDLWETVQIVEAVYQEAVVLGQARGAPDALTIRLFWQQHHVPVVSVPADTLGAYQPALTLDSGEHATFATPKSYRPNAGRGAFSTVARSQSADRLCVEPAPDRPAARSSGTRQRVRVRAYRNSFQRSIAPWSLCGYDNSFVITCQ